MDLSSLGPILPAQPLPKCHFKDFLYSSRLGGMLLDTFSHQSIGQEREDKGQA